MSAEPGRHNRRSLRLKGFDYSRPGAYFITICIQDRQCLFGEIQAGETRLNDAGRMVAKWWQELEHKFPDIQAGEFVVMPNHFHGIIYISVGADLRVGPDVHANPDPQTGGICADANQGTHAGAPLPEVVQWFKTMTTNE